MDFNKKFLLINIQLQTVHIFIRWKYCKEPIEPLIDQIG